jgi:hypothetical protein
MGDLSRKFLLASGKLQTLCYKEDIESALRTPGMGGFQLLDLHDFPGQGTALVGVLDPFWESKGYVTPGEFRRFCNSTVILARFPKRVFTQDEGTTIRLEVAHFGAAPLQRVWPVFKLVGDDGRVQIKGHYGVQDIEVGNGQALADVRPLFKELPAPAHYRFVAGLARDPEGEGVVCENDWDIWVYPPKVEVEVPSTITLVHDLDDEALAALYNGGRVLLLLPPNRIKPDPARGPVALGFSSIFWNTAWTRGQAPHTLGVLCDPKQPLFRQFPTEEHSNWQWWYLVSRAGAMILDDLPARLRPDVQVIDDWFSNRRLGLLFEAKVEQGRLLVCSIDLETDLEQDPVRRQFRASLLGYMGSRDFRPGIRLSAEQVRSVIAPVSGLPEQGPDL